jgi:hypothetical protein
MHIDWTILAIGIMGILTVCFAGTFYMIQKRRSMFEGRVIQLNIEEGTNNGTFKLLPMDRKYIIDRKKNRKPMERLHPEEEQDTHIYFGHRERAINILWPPMQPKLFRVPAKLMIHVEGHNIPIDPIAIVQNRTDEGILDSSKLTGQFADEKVMGMLVKIGNYVSQLESMIAKAIKPMHFFIAVALLLLAIGITGYLVYQLGGDMDLIKKALGIIPEATNGGGS